MKRCTTDGGPYTQVATTTTTSYTDPALINDHTYFYVVSAVNSAGATPSASRDRASAFSSIGFPALTSWQAAAKRPSLVLLVAVKPCKLPTLADHFRRCELFGMPEDAARLRFSEFMQQRGTPAVAAFPGTVFAVCNVPIRVPTHFLGREDSLTAIEKALKRYEGRDL